MGVYLFRFKIGKYEIGMYRHFKNWYFYNGYIREFMWWYIYKEDQIVYYLIFSEYEVICPECCQSFYVSEDYD